MNPMHGNRFAPEFDEMPRVGFEVTFVGSNPTSIWQKTLGHEQAPESNKWFAFN